MFGSSTGTESMVDSTNLIEEDRARAISEISEMVVGKEVVLIIGNTGAGKSTFVNYLAGCSMKSEKIADSMSKVVEAENPVVEIGHGRRPIVFTDRETELTYCEWPEIEIRNSSVIEHIANSAGSIRAVVFIVEYLLLASYSTESFQEIVSVLDQLFRGEIEAHVPPVHLMLSKAPVDGSNALELVDLIKFMQELKNPIINKFINHNRVNMYDPLNRGRSLGVLSRQDIIDTLRNSRPIQNAERLIQVSLNPDSDSILGSINSGMASHSSTDSLPVLEDRRRQLQKQRNKGIGLSAALASLFVSVVLILAALLRNRNKSDSETISLCLFTSALLTGTFGVYCASKRIGTYVPNVVDSLRESHRDSMFIGRQIATGIREAGSRFGFFNVAPQLRTAVEYGAVAPHLRVGAEHGAVAPQLESGMSYGAIAPQLTTGAEHGAVAPRLRVGAEYGAIAPHLQNGVAPGSARVSPCILM